jgi:tol-pal system protein YbgF
MVKLLILVCCAGIFLCTCGNNIALVKRSEWERQQAEINKIRGEIRKLEKMIARMEKEQDKQLKLIMADLGVLFTDVNRNLSQVRGKIEESQYDLKNLRKTTKKLSERKYVIKSVGTGAGASTLTDSVIVHDKLDVQKLFKIARADFNAKDYKRAKKEFEEIAAKYPGDEVAGDCIYWIGECHYVRKQYSKAVVEYKRAVKKYPKGDIVPAAFFKAGLCYKKLGNKKKMKKAWNELIKRFPNSDEAMLAKARMKM